MIILIHYVINKNITLAWLLIKLITMHLFINIVFSFQNFRIFLNLSKFFCTFSKSFRIFLLINFLFTTSFLYHMVNVWYLFTFLSNLLLCCEYKERLIIPFRIKLWFCYNFFIFRNDNGLNFWYIFTRQICLLWCIYLPSRILVGSSKFAI